MKNLDRDRLRWVRVRIAVLVVLLLGGAGGLVHRAFDLQVVRADELRAEAEEAQLRDVHLSPKRGTIRDRNGEELAVSVDVESIYANPRHMRRNGVSVEEAAARLAPILDLPVDRLLTRLSQDRYFVWLERQVSPEEASAVRSLEIDGISITNEAERFYPNRTLAAHILGSVNVDGEGLEGLELSLEDHLRGESASIPALRDRRGRVVFSDHLLDDRASLGDDVVLTIDRAIQAVAERELELSVRTFEAQAGSIVVMDPNSGEILAMASYPTFDPNDPGGSPPASRRFRAITDRFEPGSTVKPFTVAAALAAGVLRPNETIDCENGRMLVEGAAPITDTHRCTGPITPAEVLSHSSNIGAAKIGRRLTSRGLYRAFRRFGFGVPTGVPLPGETSGLLRHHSEWYERDMLSIAFGQGMSVNALQLATAMGVIANGGRLMEPILVRRVVDASGDIVEEASPSVRRQVVPRATARLVADMLTAVTGEEGTGAEAAIEGYLVAGKTGTAQKHDDVRGGYHSDDENRWLSSFVGFVPAEAPRLVIAVIIDEPTIDHYGGVVAGPVFRRVGEAALRHLGVPPSGSGEALERLADEIRARARAARTELEAAEAAAEASSEEAATAAENAGGEPVLDPREPTEDETRVPELVGHNLRAVMAALADAGLTPELDGSGSVVETYPAAGEIVPLGSTVRVVLERPSRRDEDPLLDGSLDSPPETERSAAPPPGEAP